MGRRSERLFREVHLPNTRGSVCVSGAPAVEQVGPEGFSGLFRGERAAAGDEGFVTGLTRDHRHPWGPRPLTEGLRGVMRCRPAVPRLLHLEVDEFRKQDLVAGASTRMRGDQPTKRVEVSHALHDRRPLSPEHFRLVFLVTR